MKFLLSAVLLAVLCFIPAVMPMETPPPDAEMTMAAPNSIMVSCTYQNGLFTAQITTANENAPATDEKMQLDPGECCDPAMLLPADTSMDPAFILGPAS